MGTPTAAGGTRFRLLHPAPPDPETLTRYGLGALGVYVLAPVVLGVLADLSRGYKGNVSAVEALTTTSDGALLAGTCGTTPRSSPPAPPLDLPAQRPRRRR